jgi:hypothetical protein
MHSTGSFLLTVIERLRAFLDEAIVDAKFTNDYLVRHVICPEMVNVMSRLSNNMDNPIRVRHEISLVADQEDYVLPPNIGEIYRFAILDDGGRITKEFTPRNEFNTRGPGWHIQGNLLSIRPFPAAAETADIHYIPNGDFQPHYAASGNLLTTTTFQLDGAPNLGSLDTRENSYAGAILRVWNTAKNILEERVVKSYDVSTRTVTLRRPFTADIETGGARTYEIAPVGLNSLYQAIACAAAINLGTSRNITQKQMQFLVLQYKMAMKTIGDNLSFMQARKPKSYHRDTVDNRASYLLGG